MSHADREEIYVRLGLPTQPYTPQLISIYRYTSLHRYEAVLPEKNFSLLLSFSLSLSLDVPLFLSFFLSLFHSWRLLLVDKEVFLFSQEIARRFAAFVSSRAYLSERETAGVLLPALAVPQRRLWDRAKSFLFSSFKVVHHLDRERTKKTALSLIYLSI